jgi:hypothetical protein
MPTNPYDYLSIQESPPDYMGDTTSSSSHTLYSTPATLNYVGAYNTSRPSSTVGMSVDETIVNQSAVSNWGSYERFVIGLPFEAVPLPKKKKSMSNPDSYHCDVQAFPEDKKKGYWRLTIKFDEALLYEEAFPSMTELEDKLHEVLGHLIKTGKRLEEGGL